MEKHRETNQLYKQVNDVIVSYTELTMSLNMALHDREQLVKEYGEQVAIMFESMQRALRLVKINKVY